MTREEAQRILATGQGDVSAANKSYYGDTGGGGYYGESIKPANQTTGPPAVNLDFTPSYEDYTGYNPTQHASAGTAEQLAKLTGGPVGMTEPTGPFQPPPQRTIGYGTPENFNAGLLARQMSRPEDSPWMKEAIMRAQLGHSAGPSSTPAYQSPFPQQAQQMAQRLVNPYGAAPQRTTQPPAGQAVSPQALSRAPQTYGTMNAGTRPMFRMPVRRPPFRFPSRFGGQQGQSPMTGG